MIINCESNFSGRVTERGFIGRDELRTWLDDLPADAQIQLNQNYRKPGLVATWTEIRGNDDTPTYEQSIEEEREKNRKVLWDKCWPIPCRRCEAGPGITCFNLAERAKGNEIYIKYPHVERVRDAEKADS